ncbi:hypothetical protein [Methanohalophilus sp. DAL1]|uniref:hypothetical protein n=1 Tax=Methanohalophilus sp. DAL1 TaxID=1864608 RepID=UPI0008180BA4|nr:hypothetical protein [Methanohalophilus sp. DAL1]OBZ35236.1 MAG: hypothetical protein A9957_08255 [Methanohalophilus sp. DAL1]
MGYSVLPCLSEDLTAEVCERCSGRDAFFGNVPFWQMRISKTPLNACRRSIVYQECPFDQGFIEIHSDIQAGESAHINRYV